MSGRRVIRQFVATAVAASLAGSPMLIGGCSFMAVRAPQKDDRGRVEPAGCTTTKAAPLADGIITAAVLGSTILVTVASAQDSNTAAPQSSGNDAMLFGGVIAALFAVSGIYGAVTVNNCRVASGMIETGPRKTSDERRAERRAEEAAEEAAVQAQKARTAAAARAAAAPAANADGGAPAAAPAP